MKLGKLFMFGFEGLRPTKEIIDFIRDDGLGGVILFKRNIKSERQLKALTKELQNAAGGGLLIAIDQEGGRVANLPASMIEVPPMEQLGHDYLAGKGTRHAQLIGRMLGEKLKSLGINVDFAPVLDVNSNHKNPIIGNRSFSSDPEVVSLLALEVVQGLMQAGVAACGKHFPGHGDTSEDSHLTLPRLGHDMKRLELVELVPFSSAIRNNIPALMSAHVVYEGVDKENPATFSKVILHNLLRKELGFDGVLFSDDLEMKAVTNFMKTPEAAVRAIKAGCDIALICHTVSEQRRAIELLKAALDSGSISEVCLNSSRTRIDSLV